MESIDKSWEKLAKSLENEMHLSKHDIIHDIRTHSKNPLEKIRNMLFYRVLYNLTAALIFGILMLYYNILVVQITMGLTVLTFVLLSILTFREYNILRNGLAIEGPTLDVVNDTLAVVRKLLRYESVFTMTTVPVSIVGIFYIGVTIHGDDVNIFFEHPAFPAVSLLVLLLSIPVGYYINKWYNRKTLGVYVDRLKKIIRNVK